VHVPYPGSAQALTDLLAGRIQLMLGAASTSLPHVEDGKLIGLGMAQRQRAAAAPKVPTLSEQGLDGFDASIWFGLMAPAGTPREIVEKVARATNESIRSEEVIGPLRAQGIDLIGGSPEDFTRHIAEDIAKWRKVAEAAGMKK
jgi:tripartite-type tricarboxylate transporter receptor subunit TctC